MSRLVASLMLLSLLVMVGMVNTLPGRPCPDGMVEKCNGSNWECVKEKREELDAPNAHKTKRGEYKL